MRGLPVAQLNLQLMHAVLGRLQLLHASPNMIPVSQPLVQVRDLLAQDPDFLLQHPLGLFRGLTGQLGPLEFLHLGGYL